MYSTEKTILDKENKMINRVIRILSRENVILNRDSRNSTRKVWLARLTGHVMSSTWQRGTFKNIVYQKYSFWDCEDVGGDLDHITLRVPIGL